MEGSVAKATASELAQPVSHVIGPNRRRAAVWALFFGVIAGSGIAKSVAAHNLTGVVICLAFVGGPSLFYARSALIGRPLIVIDDHGFTDCRSGRVIVWEDVDSAFANIHQG